MFLKGVSFHIDIFPSIVVAVGAFAFFWLWRWRRTFSEPYLAFSDITSLTVDHKTSLMKGKIPQWLMLTALGSFAIAFANPYLLVDKRAEENGKFTDNQQPMKPLPEEGIAIYLVLDQSGSMAEEVRAQTPTGQRRTMSKMELLKQVTQQFVAGNTQLGLKGRPSDMIGIIAFARSAQVLVPLTLDHETVLEELSKLDIMREKDQDGTSIGYAIFKAASMIAATRHYSQELIDKGEPGYTIKSTVMILITDGLQDPNPLDKGKRLRNIDVPDAAAYAKQEDIRLYIVNVEPKLATEEFAAYRNIMKRSAELTGGQFFMVDSSTNLQQIYQEIDRLEKSALPLSEELSDKEHHPDLYQKIAFYPYFIALGLLLLFGGLILDNFVWRKIP